MIGGRYSLDREIGRGGMGAVWLGRDEVLGREVALKRIGLLPGGDTTDLARAEREARLSARLHHPHVVSVFDVVIDEGAEARDDARWLVMEYVDGVDLGRFVQDRGRLSPEDATPLLRQIADALVAAYDAGIVHRDVKPSNIMVGRGDQVKLTDFGIARITTDPSLTQTGMVTGSPSYLAPEVVQGSRGEAPGDVWALGATAFYLLTGHPPYEPGDNVMGTLMRIVNEEPPRTPRAGPLAPLLEGTMVKDPGQRWSMRQVRDFLADPTTAAAAPAHTRVLAPTPSATLTATRAPRRAPARALLVGLVALVVVALVLALYTALSGRDSGSPGTAKPTPSPSATKKTQRAEPTAEGMESFIREYVAKVAEDPSSSWQMLTAKFQRESGGFEKYQKFWGPATNGRVRSISADPDNLTVSYQVRFDNFDNGPGPTVLDLKFDDGRYLIDGERSEGFVPAG